MFAEFPNSAVHSEEEIETRDIEVEHPSETYTISAGHDIDVG